MSMQSLIRVLSLNDVRDGASPDGQRKWSSQTAEAITMSEDGEFGKAGRIRLPKDLVGKVVPGVYMASFVVDRDETREGGGFLVPRIVGLLPYAVKGTPAPAPAKADK